MCILVVLQNVSATVCSRTATQSRGPTVFLGSSQLLPMLPSSVSRLHILRKQGPSNKLTSRLLTRLQYMGMPIDVHLLALYYITCFCMLCLVSTTSTLHKLRKI